MGTLQFGDRCADESVEVGDRRVGHLDTQIDAASFDLQFPRRPNRTRKDLAVQVVLPDTREAQLGALQAQRRFAEHGRVRRARITDHADRTFIGARLKTQRAVRGAQAAAG